MRLVRSIWQRLRPLAVTLPCWMALHGTALAAEADKAEERSGAGPWVGPYFTIILGVLLGLLGVCLSSRRKDREKPEVYAKTTLSQHK